MKRLIKGYGREKRLRYTGLMETTGFTSRPKYQNNINVSVDVIDSNNDICISNINNTLATKKRHNNNRRKTKSLHCPQLDHHDADRLAGHKAWRTAQTIMRRYKRPLISIF
jgi:hypothetical protein